MRPRGRPRPVEAIFGARRARAGERLEVVREGIVQLPDLRGTAEHVLELGGDRAGLPRIVERTERRIAAFLVGTDIFEQHRMRELRGLGGGIGRVPVHVLLKPREKRRGHAHVALARPARSQIGEVDVGQIEAREIGRRGRRLDRADIGVARVLHERFDVAKPREQATKIAGDPNGAGRTHFVGRIGGEQPGHRLPTLHACEIRGRDSQLAQQTIIRPRRRLLARRLRCLPCSNRNQGRERCQGQDDGGPRHESL